MNDIIKMVKSPKGDDGKYKMRLCMKGIVYIESKKFNNEQENEIWFKVGEVDMCSPKLVEEALEVALEYLRTQETISLERY